MGNELLRIEDLVENPTPRVPVCLVLDVSPSMSGEPIAELNEGVQLFVSEVREDEIARHSAELAIVTFAYHAECLQEFQELSKLEQVPTLEIRDGGTALGAGVRLALEKLEERKSQYQEAGVDYYQPWMVLMTDGQPTDNEHHQVAPRVAELVQQRRLSLFPIAIGPYADKEVLRMFSPLREPLTLKGLKFRELFQWLSRSVARVSQSIPGERVPLDTEGIKGWAEL